MLASTMHVRRVNCPHNIEKGIGEPFYYYLSYI